MTILAEQNAAVDVWSIHYYQPSSNGDSCYFDKERCATGPELVAAAEEAAAKAGAMLFLGEYGGPNPYFTGPTVADQAFPSAMLDSQVNSSVAKGPFMLSAIWAWQCPTHRSDMVCIWPTNPGNVANESGSDRMVSLIQSANAKMKVTN
jgi:hypothetical protein